jgi:putative transferase (TIGR04331 family)
MNNKNCLVVSNCKSCWDTSSKLAFISDSIPDYLDADELRSIDHIILDGPWKSKEYLLKSQQFVVDRVPRYRKELASILNSALDIDYSEKAWGILLDSWLLHFTSVVHDRVNKLRNAQDKLGDIFLKCLREDPQPMSTTLEFVRNCGKDPFNQRLFCDVAKAIGVKVESCTDLLLEDEYFLCRAESESLTNKMCSMISPFFRRWVQYRKPLVVVDGFFPLKKTISIFLRSFGKVLMIPDKMLLKRLPSLQKNEILRNLLKVKEKDEYDFVANKLFLKYFPLSLFEGVKDYSEKLSKLEGIPVLGSAGGFYFNEEYKILASRVLGSGNMVIGFQHGGNYNLKKNELRSSEYFEKLNAEKFYRWKEKSFSGEYLPTQKLEKLSAYREARKKRSSFSDILFLTGRFIRFTFRYEAENSDDFSEKLNDEHNFYIGLDKTIKKYFLLRAYPLEFGWRSKERWVDLAQEKIRFDPNANFYESLVTCRVFMSHSISTTWLEALYCDVPIIIFLDIDKYIPEGEARDLFDELQVVGIFHPTAESAASFLNEKYETIEEWWQMPETKAVVDKVKNYFFTVPSGNFAKEWAQELVALRDKAIKDKLNHKKSPMGLEREY